jgi:aminoglycoside phosphotransferase (APT) family kinase protein
LKDPVAPVASDRLHDGLSAYLVSRYGESAKVSGLRRLTGGTSHETWAFDLHTDASGNPQTSRSLILRRDFSGDQLDLDLATEFALLQRLFKAGIPVPEPVFCEHQNSPITTPFIISERLSGTDIRKQMAKSRDGARELGLKLTAIQASIHKLDWQQTLGDILPPPSPTASTVEVSRWSRIANKCSLSPQPLLSAAIDWLGANAPHDSPCALVHGDFKANNLVFDATGRVAVIDWELSHLGDPLEDLAFTMLWTSQYDLVGGMLSTEDYIAAYEQASGSPVDHDRLFFWQLFAQVKIAAIFLKGLQTETPDAFARPSLVMLGRALPWVEQRIAELLRIALNERNAA